MSTKEKNIDLSLLIGALVSILLAIAAGFTKDCEEMQDKAFRLHILANSDTVADQELKADVRDYILSDLGFIFKGCKTKEESIIAAEKSLPLITERVNEYLKEKNCGYKAKCSIGKCSFGTRKYGDYTLAAGEYDALKITLGKGEGHNWWCVLYPTICIGAVSEPPSVFPERAFYEEEKAKAALTKDSLAYELGYDVEYRFMIYEWLRDFFGIGD
ncbi:MAG: stage II sporulation protein R [Ruminiclostridium sp.]|nr:stage II sporulation protein R [Ruminiclostridium sp.]